MKKRRLYMAFFGNCQLEFFSDHRNGSKQNRQDAIEKFEKLHGYKKEPKEIALLES